MSIKTELAGVYNSYMRKLTEAINQVKNVTSNGEYTPDGQRVQLDAINKAFVNDVTFFRSQFRFRKGIE